MIWNRTEKSIDNGEMQIKTFNFFATRSTRNHIQSHLNSLSCWNLYKQKKNDDQCHRCDIVQIESTFQQARLSLCKHIQCYCNFLTLLFFRLFAKCETLFIVHSVVVSCIQTCKNSHYSVRLAKIKCTTFFHEDYFSCASLLMQLRLVTTPMKPLRIYFGIFVFSFVEIVKTNMCRLFYNYERMFCTHVCAFKRLI